ncbi:hypothetical protein EYF80_068138 [Liparis tanakae]|uniref:Uncharacterized protein n=1 Tax=Liparis tanakae TaxID=230148 RepID=A0A4Z2DYY0_9TELE|nr:hypothetical protein EYF80_068138 [Liparis tanakae]
MSAFVVLSFHTQKDSDSGSSAMFLSVLVSLGLLSTPLHLPAGGAEAAGILQLQEACKVPQEHVRAEFKWSSSGRFLHSVMEAIITSSKKLRTQFRLLGTG